MYTKILYTLIGVIVLLFIFDAAVSQMNKHAKKQEGFVSNQCPTTLIKEGNQILLYNPNLAKIPGVNPITFSSLKDYEEYIKWQRASKINCPILHLEKIYDTQGNKQYEVRNSFMLDQPTGPLNHDLPNFKKPPSLDLLLNADKENNLPYNQNSYPAYDQYNQNIGTTTILDNELLKTQTN